MKTITSWMIATPFQAQERWAKHATSGVLGKRRSGPFASTKFVKIYISPVYQGISCQEPPPPSSRNPAKTRGVSWEGGGVPGTKYPDW